MRQQGASLCNRLCRFAAGAGAECPQGGDRYAAQELCSRGSLARALCWASRFLTGCEQGAAPSATATQPAAAPRGSRAGPTAAGAIHDWPTGHYRVVENWPKPLTRYAPLARRLDLGLVRRRLRRKPGSHLARDARRAAAARRRGAVDAVRRAEPVARQLDRQRRRHHRHVSAGDPHAAGSGAGSTRSSSSTARATSSTSGSTSIRCSASCPAGAGRTRSRSARTTPRSTSGSSTISST